MVELLQESRGRCLEGYCKSSAILFVGRSTNANLIH